MKSPSAHVPASEPQVAHDPVKRSMLRLFVVVQELRRLYPRMELGQLAVFLAVATSDYPKATELRSRVGLEKSALSRNVIGLRALDAAAERRGEKPGLGLITQIPDPYDARAFNLSTTKKGRDLAVRLRQIMED